MKKIKENLICFIVLFFVISPSVLFDGISDLDEIWNYNTARAISMGLLPYKQVSMITTPLLPSINSIFLRVFGTELLTMRIIAILLSSLILFMGYKILRKLKVNKVVSIFSIIGIYYLYRNYFCVDYNFFNLFLVLLIIYLQIGRENESRIFNFAIGILGGICILTKQTTGMVISAALVGEKVLVLIYEKFKLNYNSDLKNEIKNILSRLLGIIMPALVFLVYLIISNSLSDFLDYCILGINTFSNKKSYLNLILDHNSVISVLAILVPIMFFVCMFKSIQNKDKNLFFMLCMSVAEFIVVYPISDNIHFLIAAFPTIMCTIYVFDKEIDFSKIKESNKKISIFFDILACEVVIMIVCFSLIDMMDFKKQDNNISNLQHLKYATISRDLEENIKKVDDYIENSDKKVYILNFDAALYMIPIDKYNKNYDMFLNGNIGSKGEEGQIENIKNEDAKYLIVKDGIGRNWQNPENVRKYIQENLKKTGEIENFDIYEN